MPNRSLILFAVVAALCVTSPAQTAKTKKMAHASGPDKAYMQQIWDGWATLDPAHTAQFYASGPHTFFDLAPLKYESWDEYEVGVKKLLAGYKTAAFTINDDAAVHHEGSWAWGTATVKSEMTTTGGKRELSTFRWTVVWQKQAGKWLIVHEHVSAPLQ